MKRPVDPSNETQNLEWVLGQMLRTAPIPMTFLQSIKNRATSRGRR